MDIVIFSGLQAAGKSTFYVQRFQHSHSRLSLDLLKSRTAEMRAFQLMTASGADIVVDNTNPTPGSRAGYISRAIDEGYRVIGYQFNISVQLALKRNSCRSNRIPDVAIYRTAKSLVPLTYDEGFTEIYVLGPGIDNSFQIARLAGR